VTANDPVPGAAEGAAGARPRSSPWQRVALWLVTLGCFAFLYTRLASAAAREGVGLGAYLAGIFSRVDWTLWILLMVPYSLFYFLVDSLVIWRIVNWFNARVRYLDILPISGSSYVLSLVNEQVRKGAMALYLYRRDGIPGWEVGSSMLFMMFCEMLTLLLWATIGVALSWERFTDPRLRAFHAIPWVALAVAIFFAAWLLYFRGVLAPGSTLRDRALFRAFREAHLRHYLVIVVFRSPAILSAVLVYTACIRLFGIDANLIEMLGYAPVIFFAAAIPSPMRAVAISAWALLFPDYVGEATVFGFVQHNFFILFNAVIGLAFFRRANREIFGSGGGAGAQERAGAVGH
jgi:hypothetical protein